MTQLIKRDNNELRFNAIWLLEKNDNNEYYENLIKNAKAFFFGMKRPDLSKELDEIIEEKIEKKIGMNINHLLMLYKHMKRIKSFTKCRNPDEEEKRVYKFEIKIMLDEIESWIFQKAITLEKQIRFSSTPRQHI